MATSSHSNDFERYAKMIRNTPGYQLVDDGPKWKVVNEGTGRTQTVHKGAQEHVMDRVLSQIRQETGWTVELYEAAAAAERKGRVRRGRRVEHRLNAFMATQREVPQETGQTQMLHPPVPGAGILGTFTEGSETAGAVELPTRTVITTPKTFGVGDEVMWNIDGFKFSITVEAVTPLVAQKYLDMIGEKNAETGHKAQRPSTKGHIEELILKMFEEKFGFGPDMLIFNADGQFINGAHRMRAMVAAWMSGRLKDDDSYLFLVSRMWPNSVFYILDHNRPRSLADTLDIQHEANPKPLAKVLRRLYLYDNVPQKEWKHFKFNDEHGTEVLEANPLIRNGAHWAKAGSKVKANGTAMWLANYLCRRASDQKYGGEVDLWFDQLCNGWGLPPNSPVHKLNQWFVNSDKRRVQERVLRTDRLWLHVYEILIQYNNTMRGRTIRGDLCPQVPFTMPQPMAYVPEAERPNKGGTVSG